MTITRKSDVMRITECVTIIRSSECRETGQVYSINSLDENHLAWSVCSNHKCYWTQTHSSLIEWKTIQASLITYTHHIHSLSSTARSQYWNAKSPNVRYRREGMSRHHSLAISTLFSSNDARLKLKLFRSGSPIIIVSNDAVPSISHTVYSENDP